jgi:hypothetical protein
MGLVTSATIDGLSRSDGTTPRTVTMVRVGQVANGFILRESIASAPNQLLAQECVHRTFEAKGSGGENVRHSSTEWKWPYESATVPGTVGGVVKLTRTGLHVPASCPVNVRKDIRTQMTFMASASGGTIGYNLVYGPLVAGESPF